MYFWSSYLRDKLCPKLIISYMQLKCSLISCTVASKLGKSPRQGQTVWDALWAAYLAAVWCLYYTFPPVFSEAKSRWFWWICVQVVLVLSHWEHCPTLAGSGTRGNRQCVSKQILCPLFFLPRLLVRRWPEGVMWRSVPRRWMALARPKRHQSLSRADCHVKGGPPSGCRWLR